VQGVSDGLNNGYFYFLNVAALASVKHFSLNIFCDIGENGQ
jgi:hypothetical protein